MRDIDSIKQINKKIQRGQYVTLKSNQNFYDFYNELKKYFATHLMPTCNLQLKDYNAQYYSFNNKVMMSESVIKISDPNLCNITILPHKRGVNLYRLEIYQTGQGYGTIFMNAFNEISKSLNVKIYLIPGDPGFNTTGDAQKRRDFYHKFNFRREKDSKYWVN